VRGADEPGKAKGMSNFVNGKFIAQTGPFTGTGGRRGVEKTIKRDHTLRMSRWLDATLAMASLHLPYFTVESNEVSKSQWAGCWMGRVRK